MRRKSFIDDWLTLQVRWLEVCSQEEEAACRHHTSGCPDCNPCHWCNHSRNHHHSSSRIDNSYPSENSELLQQQTRVTTKAGGGDTSEIGMMFSSPRSNIKYSISMLECSRGLLYNFFISSSILIYSIPIFVTFLIDFNVSHVPKILFRKVLFKFLLKYYISLNLM